MNDAVAALKAHEPKHEYLIAIDSDGCVFDTMSIKQKECFIPNTIKFFGLQGVAKYCREAQEWVNLYSKWRGVNRFPAIIKTFDLLEEWDKVQALGVELPKVPKLRQWIEVESKLGNPVLEAYCAEHSKEEAPDMHLTLEWSKAVNDTVTDIVQGGLPPFPYVRDCLEKARGKADMMVCSQTPCEALVREWEEQGLDSHVFTICGQEMGTKGEHIQLASEGRYDNEKILMIGDAKGDLKAARQNDALFFPINPGQEEGSWERLRDEALDKFFAGDYAGGYEDDLIAEFDTYLPDTPPWQQA